jgi:hypothetical protein
MPPSRGDFDTLTVLDVVAIIAFAFMCAVLFAASMREAL